MYSLSTSFEIKRSFARSFVGKDLSYLNFGSPL